jgi:hypothetical protein
VTHVNARKVAVVMMAGEAMAAGEMVAAVETIAVMLAPRTIARVAVIRTAEDRSGIRTGRFVWPSTILSQKLLGFDGDTPAASAIR